MSSIRMGLLVLGILARRPMHGHQLRREAELSNVQAWGEVHVGALYNMLHKLERDGLIETVRTERAGRRPVRTIYAITDRGRAELGRLREAAMDHLGLGSVPVDVAVAFAPGDDPAELRRMLRARRDRLAALLRELGARREADQSQHRLPAAGLAVYRHWEIRIEAELRWHDEIEQLAPAVATEYADDRMPSETPM